MRLSWDRDRDGDKGTRWGPWLPSFTSHFAHELLGEASEVTHKGVWCQCDGAPGAGETINAAGFALWLFGNIQERPFSP